ncbi:MAG: hypothetical protein ACREAD_08325 [Nitrosopumilaceae archaeon]
MVEKTKSHILKPRITYLAFLECEIRGNWISEEEERIDLNGQEFPQGRHSYLSTDKGCELWVVQLDTTRKAFSFKKHSEIEIIGTTIKFDQDDVIDELVVDDDKKLGKRHDN